MDRQALTANSRTPEEVGPLLSDLSDWASGHGRQSPLKRGRSLSCVRSSPRMSLKTVTRLSADWHEAVASHMVGPQFAFPPPWYPAAKVGGFEILPIDNSAALYREGAAMHHCIGTTPMM